MTTSPDETLTHIAWLPPEDHEELVQALKASNTMDIERLGDARLELAVATVRERLCPVPSQIARRVRRDDTAIEVRFTQDELDALEHLTLSAALRRQLRRS